MLRKVLVLPSRKPRSLPLFTCTTGGFRFGESAAFGASPLLAPNADAGSIIMPASVEPTTAAPPSRARRFIEADSDDSCDLRFFIQSPLHAAATAPATILSNLRQQSRSG